MGKVNALAMDEETERLRKRARTLQKNNPGQFDEIVYISVEKGNCKDDLVRAYIETFTEDDKIEIVAGVLAAEEANES